MDEEEEKKKEEEKKNTVDELVSELSQERDRYKALYEKEREAHAKTLRNKLLGGKDDGDDGDDDDGDGDEEENAVKRLKEKYKKRSK